MRGRSAPAPAASGRNDTPQGPRSGIFWGLGGHSNRNRIVKIAFPADRARGRARGSMALGRATGRLDPRSTAGRAGVAGHTAACSTAGRMQRAACAACTGARPMRSGPQPGPRLAGGSESRLRTRFGAHRPRMCAKPPSSSDQTLRSLVSKYRRPWNINSFFQKSFLSRGVFSR